MTSLIHLAEAPLSKRQYKKVKLQSMRSKCTNLPDDVQKIKVIQPNRFALLRSRRRCAPLTTFSIQGERRRWRSTQKRRVDAGTPAVGCDPRPVGCTRRSGVRWLPAELALCKYLFGRARCPHAPLRLSRDQMTTVHRIWTGRTNGTIEQKPPQIQDPRPRRHLEGAGVLGGRQTTRAEGDLKASRAMMWNCASHHVLKFGYRH